MLSAVRILSALIAAALAAGSVWASPLPQRVLSKIPTDAIAAAQAAQPVRFHPALIIEPGTKSGDKSFTEAAEAGANHAKSDLKINYDTYALPADNNREALMKKAIADGANHIIAVGFENVLPVLRLAEANPGVKFTVIDGIVPPLYTNVQSVLFKDHEGAFLVGMIAALTSRTGTIGFVGGMDVPLIRNFSYGYQQGARYAKPDIKILSDMIGATREAWSNPAMAAQLAKKQYDDGADIIFAAAGGSTLGVLQTAKTERKLAIGVDTNQNGLFPGHVLTSMVKRVDKAVYDVLRAAQAGKWEPGIKYLGAKENFLDFAVDANNKDLLSKDMIDKVEKTKDLIIRGIVNVEMYSPK